jgi:hypothetical protein
MPDDIFQQQLSLKTEPLVGRWIGTINSALRPWWARHGAITLRFAVPLMVVVALVWLGYESWRLLWQQGYWGAIDLGVYHRFIHGWFAGKPIYAELRNAVHPPATYVILWPFLGWLSVTAARWFWAATTVAMLVWLVRLVVRESKADTPLERVFMMLVPLSMYATGATIGNGQLTIHLLAPLVCGLSLLCSKELRLGKELLGAALFLLALAKPTISAPFFWIVLFNTGRLRAALYVVCGYVGLTLFATSFQESSLPMLFQDWLANPGIAQRGESNLQAWLGSLGLKEWSLPAALLALAALGLWTYRHRHVDLWLLLGVSAIVARLWTYHRWYDDLLILLPMVALFRIAKAGPSDGGDVLAGVLFAITLLAMLAPGGLYLFPSPWNTIYMTGQVIIWLAVLFFLLDRAGREKYAAIG